MEEKTHSWPKIGQNNVRSQSVIPGACLTCHTQAASILDESCIFLYSPVYFCLTCRAVFTDQPTGTILDCYASSTLLRNLEIAWYDVNGHSSELSCNRASVLEIPFAKYQPCYTTASSSNTLKRQNSVAYNRNIRVTKCKGRKTTLCTWENSYCRLASTKKNLNKTGKTMLPSTMQIHNSRI